MKSETSKIVDFKTADRLGEPKALYRLPKDLQKLFAAYCASRPHPEMVPEDFEEMQANQDKAVRDLVDITAGVVEQQGSVSQPALVARSLSPLFDRPRYEVRSLDRADADPGRALFVTADPALEGELRIGDVVVLSADGGRIIDMDNDLGRTGETGTVVGIHPDQDFPYEVELEGDGHLHPRKEAMLWERLNPRPVVGDRVKVMGGFIHAYAPGESAGRFIKNPWRHDLDLSHLCGPVPRTTAMRIEAKVDKFFHPENYPETSGRFEQSDALLIYGPPGVGKTWTVTVVFSILQRKYNNGRDRVVFIVTEGSAIEGALVGSGPKALRKIRSLAKKAISEDRLPITFINEAGTLLRSRETQGMMLDGGSSLSTHEQLLAMLSGADEIPGIIIVDLNMEKMLDEATRQRFTCVAYPHIDRSVMVDQMFKTAFEKEPDLIEGDWEGFRSAILASFDTVIGTVLVGSKTVPVKVGNLTSGRLFDRVIRESFGQVELCIFSAAQKGMVPLFTRITPSLLYYTLTQRTWSLFKCWDDRQARERLVPELVRPEKSGSISRPGAADWHGIEMPSEYDCRELLDDMVGEDSITAVN